MNTDNNNIKIIKDYFDALQSGNFAKLTNLLDNNIIWHQPGNNQFSGIKKGLNNVNSMISKMLEISENTFKINEIHFIAGNNDLVNCLINFQAKTLTNNKGLNQKGCDLFRIKNNKIIEVWLFSSDQQAEDNYWGI